MALATLIIGLAVVGVSVLWTTMRFVRWSLAAEDAQVPVGYPWQIGRTLAGLMALLYVWDGLAHWLTAVWNLLL